jgi:hypothetical protein
MGGSCNKSGRREDPKERFGMGHFITPDQWENQEQDVRTSCRGTHQRSGNTRLQQTSRRQRIMEATSEGSGPRRGCGAIDGNELKTTMIAVQLTLQVRIETSTFTDNNVVQKTAQLGGNRYSSNR